MVITQCTCINNEIDSDSKLHESIANNDGTMKNCERIQILVSIEATKSSTRYVNSNSTFNACQLKKKQ